GWLFLLASGLIFIIKKAIQKYKDSKIVSHAIYGPTFLCLLLAIPLAVSTTKRNIIWSSGLEFWGNIIQNAPGKARAYNNYGVDLSQKMHKFQESVPYFKKAIAMDGNYPDPCNNLAVAYAQL